MDDGVGALDVTILSVYDLLDREEPTCVSVTVCGVSVTSGSPSSRHKDRNSFKFSNDSNKLVVSKALRDLYGASMTVTVIYANQVSRNLKADYAVNQLRIHENTWLILNLESNNNRSDEATGADALRPSIRIKVQLRGPYRVEFKALVSICQKWFSVMDSVESSTKKLVSTLPQLPSTASISTPMLLLPAVPIATLIVVLAPVILGFLVVSIPVLLPFLVALCGVLACLAGTCLALYVSTSGGRQYIYEITEPAVMMFLTNPSSQTLIYDTGPRPTPVRVIRAVLPSTIWSKLFLSLGIDLIGSSSYLIPVVGEIIDLPWAPIQTLFITAMYDAKSPNLKYVSFVEEILPFTDAVPSATIGWLMEFGPQILAGNVEGKEADAGAIRAIQKYAPEDTKKFLIQKAKD